MDMMMQERDWMKKNQAERQEIISDDGLKLRAIYIPHKNAKGTIICMHGYRSEADIEFVPEVRFLWELGYNLLLPYQRSQGESQGKYITYGVKERYDCRRWVEYANVSLGAETGNLFLCGISMGCATVLMTTALHLPPNVRGIIADCGFTSPWNIIRHVAKRDFHLPAFPMLYILDALCRVIAGFGLRSVSTVDAMKQNKIPVLFIHGEEDDYVPVSMTYENYRACAAPKELYIVKGAGHALAFTVNMEEGKKRIGKFIKKYERM